MLAAKQCPASEYQRITYDDRNCGFSGQKACDQQYSAPGQAWQDCYHHLNVCREQIDADNQVIQEANRVYVACQAKHSSSGSPNNSGSSDLASRLAAQQAKNSDSDEVRRQQDQQFSATVQSAQQGYQQQKAAELAEALAQCNSRHEQDFATCNGNTDQFYKENFPAVWVNMEGIACRNTANVRLNLCQTIAKGDPDSRAENLRQLLQRTKTTHKNISDNIASYMPQPATSDDSDYVYQSPISPYQGRPQQSPPSPTRPSQPYIATPRGGCVGDSTVCSGGGSAPRSYVPPPQPRFIAPSGAVR